MIPPEPPTSEAPGSPAGSAVEQLLLKLADFEPTTLPVLSVYLNMQSDQHGRTPDPQPYLEREFKALARTWPAGTPERQSFDCDAERILAFIAGHLDTSTNGLALFACSAKEFFETIQLAAPIREHRIYVYSQPHLYQLALIDDENPRYAALLTDANRARIFVFGLGKKLDDDRIDRQENAPCQGGRMVASALSAARRERSAGTCQGGRGASGSNRS